MIHSLRLIIQHLSFLVLLYGGHLKIRLGAVIPCFSCPFVGTGCSGACYLFALQGGLGFGMTLENLTSWWVVTPIIYFVLFLVLLALLGKAWCGWICPFGLLQDWLTMLRKKIGLREMQISPKLRKRLAPIKYILLIYLVATPPLITLGLLHPDFSMPFCNICPGKSILPVFAGNTRYLALNLNNIVLFTYSLALLMVTGGMLLGMFFKERFFCIFCPMLALIHILKPLTLLKLVKEPHACIGCGNCRRSCPMDIQEVYLQKTGPDVQTHECIDCATCVEACASDGALKIKFWRFTLFSSSRKYASGILRKLRKAKV